MKKLGRSVVVLGLVWLMAGIPAGPSSAQSGDGLGGFGTSAWGSSFSMIYVDPKSPIPASPTGEMHAAYTLATLEFGPSGHGLAAQLYPGEAASTAGPFVEQSFWDGFEAGFEENDQEPPIPRQRVVPRWPLAAEVFEPQGPNEQEVPPNSRAVAKGRFVSAESATVPLELPQTVTMAAGGSTARTAVESIELSDGREVEGAISQVTATAEDIDILQGLVTVDQVTTTAKVVSDGENAQVSGNTKVTGFKILDQEFFIDEEGIHQGEETQPNPVLGQLQEAGETALADNGVTVMVVKPLDSVDGAMGARSVGGLIVRIDSRRFQEAVSSLPPELQTELAAAGVSTDHTLTLIFGAANVSASAAKAFSFEPPSFDFTPPAPPPPAPVDTGASVLGNEVSAPPQPAPTAAPAAAAASSSAPPPQPSAVTFSSEPAFAAPVAVEGVSAVAAIVGLGLVIAAARGLHWMSGALLTPAGAQDDCSI